MDKEKLIEAINQKGLMNSLISIYYNIGRALPFTAQRFPDGRISEWYRNQYVEVREVKPSGKGGKYGNAFGYYFRNGERANSCDEEENSWCKKDDVNPQSIPSAACGSWVLLDIYGEPTCPTTKIYGLNDILEKGKHKGETVADVVHNDWGWIKWACTESQHFYFDIDEILEERKKCIKVLHSDDILPFGKYKGQTIKTIAENDYQYLMWVKDNSEDFIIDFSEIKIK